MSITSSQVMAKAASAAGASSDAKSAVTLFTPKTDYYMGEWTDEEAEYVNALINHFRTGTLEDATEGTTLRGYIAKKIGCKVKRVSKRYECTDYNGRQPYKSCSRSDDKAAQHLEALRLAFLESRKELQEKNALKVKNTKPKKPKKKRTSAAARLVKASNATSGGAFAANILQAPSQQTAASPIAAAANAVAAPRLPTTMASREELLATLMNLTRASSNHPVAAAASQFISPSNSQMTLNLANLRRAPVSFPSTTTTTTTNWANAVAAAAAPQFTTWAAPSAAPGAPVTTASILGALLRNNNTSSSSSSSSSSTANLLEEVLRRQLLTQLLGVNGPVSQQQKPSGISL